MVAADWRRGVDPQAVAAALQADKAHAIKAVLAVHNETATGMAMPLPEIRGALDAAGHPALLLVDTISSLGSLEFRMDEWGIDGVVGGSQKGLMLPTGFSFTAVSPKGMQAHAEAKLPRHYFDWSEMMKRSFRSFVGTVPVASVLRSAREPAPDRGRGAGSGHRAASPPGRGDAPRRADLVGQCRAATLLPRPGALLGQRHRRTDAGGA